MSEIEKMEKEAEKWTAESKANAEKEANLKIDTFLKKQAGARADYLSERDALAPKCRKEKLPPQKAELTFEEFQKEYEGVMSVTYSDYQQYVEIEQEEQEKKRKKAEKKLPKDEMLYTGECLLALQIIAALSSSFLFLR